MKTVVAVLFGLTVLGMAGPVSSFQSGMTRPALAEQGKTFKVSSEPCADPAVCHLVANRFAQRVGELLKASWPSRVLNPHVQIETVLRDRQEMFVISYWCQIAPTTPDRADWLFDRRGTILSGPSMYAAKEAVEKEIQASGKIQELRNSTLGFGIPYLNFVQDDWVVSDKGIWYIRELFFVAPRPKQ